MESVMDGHRGKRRLDSADDTGGQGRVSVLGTDMQRLGGLNHKRRCVPAHEGPGFHIPSRQKASRRLLFMPNDASSLSATSALANDDSAAYADEQRTVNGTLPTHCGFSGPSMSLTAEARRKRKAYMDTRRPKVDSLHSAPCTAEARRKREISMLPTKPPGTTNASCKQLNSQSASRRDDELEFYDYGAGILAGKLIPHTGHEYSTSVLASYTRHQCSISNYR
ncbi:hypothetical protein EJB05_01236, partial [Eragrostis curvula]